MSNMDWEYRKSLLIRALFAEQPVLSPITEAMEDEETLSPLPELIIEREPNKHDEPEGFYRQLKLKIKQLFPSYVFRNKDGATSSTAMDRRDNDESQHQAIFTNHHEETHDEVDDDFGTDYDTISMELLEEISPTEDLRYNNSIDKNKTIDGLSSNHLSPTFTQEERRAAEISIHSFDDSLMEHENEEQASRESNTTADDGSQSHETDSSANPNETTDKSYSELEENVEKSLNESQSSAVCDEETSQSSLQSVKSIEAIREPREIQTFHSPAQDLKPIDSSADNDEPNVNVSIDGLTEASFGPSTASEDLLLAGSFYERDIDDSDPSFMADLIRSSTPKTFDEESPSKVDKSVNVCFDDIDWNDLKKELFVGDCKVYNICRCRSHICEDYS